MFFWNSLAFLMIQQMLSFWSLVPLPSKSSLNVWTFLVHILLKPSLENFELYLASMWDKCKCEIIWTFFGIAFLVQFCGHCWVFQIFRHIECRTFTALSFRIQNSSTGIPSSPLAFFKVMPPKANLTFHSRMSGSRWVITALWLSGSWRSFLYSSSVYSYHILLISSGNT